MFTIKAHTLLGAVLLLLQSIDVFAQNTKKLLENKASLETVYKNVVDELVNVGKAHTPSQPKVYAVLDQLDTIHASAKHAFEQEDVLKDALKKKEAEVLALQQDILTMKTEHDNAQKKLSLISKKLSEEKNQNKLFAEEKKKLEKQVGTLQAMNTVSPADQTLSNKDQKSEKIDEK